MSDKLVAGMQAGISCGFHIIFAVTGEPFIPFAIALVMLLAMGVGLATAVAHVMSAYWPARLLVATMVALTLWRGAW